MTKSELVKIRKEYLNRQKKLRNMILHPGGGILKTVVEAESYVVQLLKRRYTLAKDEYNKGLKTC